MTLKNLFKANKKFSYGSIIVITLGCVLIFQNCGRIVLSDKIDSQLGSSAVITAYDFDANDIIETMLRAEIEDSNEFNDNVDLSAETMTCGNRAGSTVVECVFKKGTSEYSTSDATATSVKNYLDLIGITLNCPTCSDSVSFTVRNLICVRDPEFPREATCTFKR